MGGELLNERSNGHSRTLPSMRLGSQSWLILPSPEMPLSGHGNDRVDPSSLTGPERRPLGFYRDRQRADTQPVRFTGAYCGSQWRPFLPTGLLGDDRENARSPAWPETRHTGIRGAMRADRPSSNG